MIGPNYKGVSNGNAYAGTFTAGGAGAGGSRNPDSSTVVGDLIIAVVQILCPTAGTLDVSSVAGGGAGSWTLLADSGMVEGAGAGSHRVKIYGKVQADSLNNPIGANFTGPASAAFGNTITLITYAAGTFRPIGVDGGPLIGIAWASDTADVVGTGGRSVDTPAFTPPLKDGDIIIGFFTGTLTSPIGTPSVGTTPSGFTPLVTNLGDASNELADSALYRKARTGSAVESAQALNINVATSSSRTYPNEIGFTLQMAGPNTAPAAPSWGATPAAGAVYDASVPKVINPGADAEDATLVFDIDRSTDGSTWTNIYTGLGAAFLNNALDSTLWPASATTRLRVRARDPYNAASAYVSSSIFSVQHTSHVKYWNGSAWVVKPLKRWDGTTWANTKLKRWNGSAWVSLS